MSAERLRTEIRRWCNVAGTQKVAAKTLGVSPQYLSDVLLGRREPGDSILRAMGYERVVSYRRKSR